MPGIVVAGGSPACGKTALITGLALALKDNGFRVQAFKPLELETHLTKPAGQDQAYINAITKQYLQAETLVCPSAWDVTPILWQKFIERCKTLEYPCLLEAPGQMATPWQLRGERWQLASDVAHTLGIPVLLVLRASPLFFDEALSALLLLQQTQTEVAGFIRVQTRPQSDPPSPAEPLQLAQHFGTTFIGDMPYSPSISVEAMQQGNLMRITQENIDLLPIQMAMGLTL